MSDVVQELDEIAARLAALDLDTMSDDELHDVTIGTRRSLERLSVGVSRCLARWDARQVWALDQSRSARSRLSREVKVSMTTAGRDLRRARALTRLPGCAAAVQSGGLSMDHVDVLAPAEAANPDQYATDETVLVEQCATVPLFAQARAVVDYWRSRADPDGSVKDPADGRSWHASTTIGGTVAVTGSLDPIGGAIYTGELDRLTEQLRLTDDKNGVTRTAAQRRAAAQIEMAVRSAAMPPGSVRPRPMFTALVGDGTVAELCELAAGHLVTPAMLAPYLDTADLEVVLFDGPSTVLSVSKKRSFTGAVRRAIQVRDRHCQHPSVCDVPASKCDVDHIVPWPDSRRTDQFNGRLECPTHNRHPHRHDHHAQPLPERRVDSLEAARARIRWQLQHEPPELDDPDPDPDDDAAARQRYLDSIRTDLRRQLVQEWQNDTAGDDSRS